MHRWTVQPLVEIARRLVDTARRDLAEEGVRTVIAVDGRSGSGKSTLAARLADHLPNAAVVHTDDVAWWESFFGWDELLVDGVLAPFVAGVAAGTAVSFTPPAWQRRGRVGAIEVPSTVSTLIVEGVGASRQSLHTWLGAAVWVQSDVDIARRRGIERDGGTEEAREFWDTWEAEEIPFLAADQPWLRAHVIVCGTPECIGLAHDPATQALVGIPKSNSPMDTSLAPTRRPPAAARA